MKSVKNLHYFTLPSPHDVLIIITSRIRFIIVYMFLLSFLTLSLPLPLPILTPSSPYPFLSLPLRSDALYGHAGGTGGTSVGGMIASALMPYEAISGPSIALERDRRGKRTYASSIRYGQSPADLFTFSPSPMSVEAAPPTRQSSRLASLRRTASLLDRQTSRSAHSAHSTLNAHSAHCAHKYTHSTLNAHSTHSTHTRSPHTRSPHTPSPSSTPFLSPGSVFSVAERERNIIFIADLTINTGELVLGTSSFQLSTVSSHLFFFILFIFLYSFFFSLFIYLFIFLFVFFFSFFILFVVAFSLFFVLILLFCFVFLITAWPVLLY